MRKENNMIKLLLCLWSLNMGSLPKAQDTLSPATLLLLSYLPYAQLPRRHV
jgi:hypothetical protein